MTGDTPYPTAAQQFGKRLATSRECTGLSLRALAEITGVPKSVIARLESGITSPSAIVAQKLDEALGAQGRLAGLGDVAPERASPYLPPTPPIFLGREEELIELTRLARRRPASPERPAVLFIVGPPGIGKTAVALRWANSMQELFDVVLWSDLHGRPAMRADVLEDLLRGLGITADRRPAGERLRESFLRDQLRRRSQRVLVVLDDAGGPDEVGPLLPALEQCTVLVTSRSPLGNPGSRSIRLETMPACEGVRLASTIIGEERASKERDSVAKLVDLCGGLPLATITAAERVAAMPDKSIRWHVEEMADPGRRLRLLDVDESVDHTGDRAVPSCPHRSAP